MKRSWYSLYAALVGFADGVAFAVCHGFCRSEVLPPPTVNAIALERQDLKRGEMPEQPTPPATVARVTRDQRPALRLFTTPRTDFAF